MTLARLLVLYAWCVCLVASPTGELAPGTSIRCPLQLLALVAGLHELRGCTVADMHTAQEFPQGKLRDVLVEFPNEQEEETAFVEGKRGEMLRS